MSDKGHDHDQKPETLSARAKENIDKAFSRGEKLFHDSYNGFGWMQNYETPEQVQTIRPLLHYRQIYTERVNSEGKRTWPDAAVDYVMELSDQTAVAAFDKLIDEFNADIERIKQNNDVGAIKKFIERMIAVIYAKG